ncbi:MAG: hypothetical protein GY761_03810 [Hyphomicrobiales bacterium]|nr:hypothetical protein [Hyphomicrobiales bacterium]
MPTLELRDRSNLESLDPLAHFKLLSVMFYPKSKSDRQKMMSTIQREAGINKTRVGPLTEIESEYVQKSRTSRGILAGSILMTRAQLHLNGLPSNQKNAIAITQYLLPDWIENQTAKEWDDYLRNHIPRSPGKIADYLSDFKSVAHLWAALLHEQQNEREDILPISNDRIPVFLGYADEFDRLFDSIPIRQSVEMNKFQKKEKWSFKLPDGMKIRQELVAEPFPDELLNLIT